MKCIILAAGYAIRMYPLTENYPKPLLEIANKKIIDYLIEDLEKTNLVDEYIVVSNHKFINYFTKWAENKEKVKVLDDKSTDNENRLGAVRDILFAIKSEKLDEDLLILAGDNILDFSLSTFLNYFKEKNTSCIMRYYEEFLSDTKKYCTCTCDENDYVLEMKEKVLKPESHYLVPPFYIYKKTDLPLIEKALLEGCPYDAPGSLVEALCSKTDFHAMKMIGSRYDIGTIELYENLKKTFKLS